MIFANFEYARLLRRITVTNRMASHAHTTCHMAYLPFQKTGKFSRPEKTYKIETRLIKVPVNKF